MPCACKRCREHYITLGLDPEPTSASEVREAYRDAVQIWHPDRFEGNQRLRQRAEEQFKCIQVAYRELVEHDPKAAAPPPPKEPVRNRGPRNWGPQHITFDGAPGCFTATNIPPRIVKRVRDHMGSAEVVLGAVALAEAVPIPASTHPSHDTDSSFEDVSFFAITNNGLMVNDGVAKNDCLRYEDLGELKMEAVFPIFLRNDPLHPLRKQLGLRIERSDKTCYYVLWYSPDDSVVQTIHDFLQEVKASEAARP